MTDALADVLSSVRMEGSVFSRAALRAPWGVEAGDMSGGVFHAVVSGAAWVRLASGGPPVALQAGDVVMMPFGDNHLMTDLPETPARPIADLTTLDGRGMGHLVVDGSGPATSLICGTVAFDDADAHPVFSVLPPLIHARDNDGRMSAVVETMIELIAAEIDEPIPGSETVVARLTDVLVILVLRDFIRQLPHGHGGWLGGLADPVIAEALGLIHRSPDRAWTARDLAHAVGMSRSAFYDRFRAATGSTPADYLTRWRIHLGARLLREEGRSVGSAGRAVGYRTEAAFSNAFLRVMGVRPGAYRHVA